MENEVQRLSDKVEQLSVRDRVKAANDIREEVVDVPEWGVKLIVKSMTAGERSVILREFLDEEGNVTSYGELSAAMVVASCYDPDTGGKAFLPEDREWMASKNVGVIERLASLASSISGLNPKAVGKAGEVSLPTLS